MLQPLHEPVEDLTSGPRVAQMVVAGKGQVIEVRPVTLELGQITLVEVNVLRVERLKVAIEKLAGHYCIKRLLQIVVVGKHVRRGRGDRAVNRARAYRVEGVGE